MHLAGVEGLNCLESCRLLELQQGLKALFMSGYVNTNVVKHYVEKQGFASLHKEDKPAILAT